MSALTGKLARIALKLVTKFGGPITITRNATGTYVPATDSFSSGPTTASITGKGFAATEDRLKLDPRGDFATSEVLLLLAADPTWAFTPSEIGLRTTWAGRGWRVDRAAQINPDGAQVVLWLVGLAQ